MYISFAKTSRKRAIARWRNRWRRLIGSLTLFIFTVSLITTLGHLPPALAVDRFICDGTLYISQSRLDPFPTQLSRLDRGDFGLEGVGEPPLPTSQVRYNGMGFNVKDGFIYGIDPQITPNVQTQKARTVYRIGKDGQVDDLGVPEGLPADASFFAGDFDGNGNYLIYDLNKGRLFKLNVNVQPGQNPPTVIGQPVTLTIPGDYADLAFNPVDEKLYGVRTSSRQLSVIDPVTGNVTPFANPAPGTNPYGAVFFDAFGNLFAYENGNENQLESGTLYLVNVGVNGNGSGSFTKLGNANGVRRNDGAGCAFAPKVEKTVDPPEVTAGEIVTYTYRIVNRTSLDPLANLTFTDTLGDGRTFVDGSLTLDPATVQGTPNAFGGTSTLQINNLSLPNQTIATITVKVQIPLTTPSGTILNQSQLNGIPVNFGGPTILSDYPPGYPPAKTFPSPTPLVVKDNPVKLEASKTAQVIDNSDNPTAAPGKELLYTVTIKNTGTAPSTNTVSTDDIPANTTYVPNSTTLNGNSVADVGSNMPFVSGGLVNSPGQQTGTINPGETATLQFRVRINDPLPPGVTKISNQASVTSDQIKVPVLTDSPGSSGGSGGSDPTDIPIGNVPPSANKSVRFLRDNDGSGNLTIGDDIQYKIVVRNPSPIDISNLVISDAIPIQWQVLRDASNPITVDSGFSLASTLPSSSFESTGSSVAFTEPGTLAPGASVTLTFNVRIRPGAASPLINQGTINYQGDNGKPVLTDASDSTNPTAPGSGVNPGNPNPLNPDGSGGNVNQPNAGNADPTIINLVSPVIPTGTKSVRLFTDADSSGAVTTGDTLEYTITYSNTSSSDVNNFLATDNIDSKALRFVSGSYSLTRSGTGTTVAANPNYNGTTDTNLNTRGTLGRGGGQVVIKYRAVVLAAAGTKINNQARAASSGGNVNPSLTDALQKPGDLPQLLDDGINQGNIAGNTGDDDPTSVTVGGSGTGPLRPVANKSVRFLRDNDRTGNLTIGDDIQYKIIVQNRNPIPITNLTISDAIPFQWQVLRDASNPITVDSGFSLASPPALPSSSFVSTGNTVTFTNQGTLAPGATMTLTFNVRIRPGSPSPLINQGTINFQGANGNPVLTDASDSTNPTGPGSDVNPGNPSPLNPDGSGGNVNQPNAGNADPTIIKFVSPITPTGTKSVRLFTDADGSGAVTSGDTLEYTITYSNTSSSDVTDFLATDSIDSNGLRFVSGSYSLTRTGTGTTVAANPNYNGTTDTNLNTPGTLGRGGGQVVIKYRAVVLAAAGTKINNQARATSIGGNVSQSLTDALQGPGDLPQVLDDGINQGNLSDTGDDEPTGVTVGDVGNPRLRLVKRITSVTRAGVPISGINFSTFVDDPADDNDNAPGWSQLSPVGVFKLGSEVSLQSGDEVEYTIYFLSDGAQNSRNIKFCDLIPAGTTFIPDSLGPGIGIRLRQGGTQSDQTNASDTDQGIFYSPLTPVTAPCSDPKNPNGAVFLQLGNIPNTAPNNGGFVRFRVRID